NWKLQLENSVDDYHADFVHKSFFELAARRAGRVVRTGGGPDLFRTWDIGGGHAVLDIEAGGIKASDALGQPHKRHGPGYNLLVFPNLSILFSQVRHFLPIAVERTEVRLHPVIFVGLPDSENQRQIREHNDFYGPAGFGSPDDWEMFARVHKGVRSEAPQWILFNRGLQYEERDEQGFRSAAMTDETPQRAIYRHWKTLMGAE
ncbi:MAG TPA: SRPBCC family protein, partial [Dehalococcoidia bacterium]|nr:SRPBCC family protein [Dehalococcoidia bacterium]